MSAEFASLQEVEDAVVVCRRCPRLVAWREQVATEKRAAYADEDYWGRPVPGFGDPEARLLLVGLAPAAHGANRTGRMFTGDRSGDWLYAALHRAGFANQPESVAPGDGLTLHDAWVTAPVKCAPPQNRPTAGERDNCRPYLEAEIDLLPVAVVIALGGFGWDVCMRHFNRPPFVDTRVSPKPKFGHGAVASLGEVTVLGSYHPSQQNTFTGRLTKEMFDTVFDRARELLSPDVA